MQNGNKASLIAVISMLLAVIVAAYAVVFLVSLVAPLVKLAVLVGIVWISYVMIRKASA